MEEKTNNRRVDLRFRKAYYDRLSAAQHNTNARSVPEFCRKAIEDALTRSEERFKGERT